MGNDKKHLYGDKECINPYKYEDKEAKVCLGRILLSDTQKRDLRDDGKCYMTDEQDVILDKFKDRKISHLPAGWDAFINADVVYFFVYNEVCPMPKGEQRQSRFPDHSFNS